MPSEQIFIGLTSAALCVAGLWREGWLLAETRKGRKLVAFFGDRTAMWVLRVLLAAGVLFGLMLALGVISPLRWESSNSRDAEHPGWSKRWSDAVSGAPQQQPYVRRAALDHPGCVPRPQTTSAWA